MSLAPGVQLGPYEIRSQLGSGGMGVVYTARDPRLDRQVAIKVLPSDLTRDDTAKQRFLQEAKAASALDHPNICNIHEINETADGQLYLVMAYYEGETLKERIAPGPLAIDEAIDIATQVGQGLAKAHAAGIVHRDIKPANLMVTADGTVKILDFGLAKLAGSEGVTVTGTTVGTVAYMSPEQAEGLEVDHRTDVWSLGVVLYEMLAGRRPFTGDTLLAVSKAILATRPTPVAILRTEVSSALDDVVTRMIGRALDERYRSVADAVSDLRRAQGASGTRHAGTDEHHDEPSIAVLPFASMSTDPENEFFADGISEDIINALTQLKGLHVAARTSSFAFKGQNPDIAQVGAKLKVKTVLEGSVRRAGNRLRVNAQLIDVADGYHIWSERFDRDLEDVFAIQDEIATRIADRLKVTLDTASAASELLVKPQTGNLDAYQLYIKGRALLNRRGADLAHGIDCFRQAVELDPAYALAWAELALAYALRGYWGGAPGKQAAREAREALARATELGPDLAETHHALASVSLFYDRDNARSEREFERALEINPHYTQARVWHGALSFLCVRNRPEEALAHTALAVENDPLSGYAHALHAITLALARGATEGVGAALTAVELDPGFLSQFVLSRVYHWAGRFAEAAATGRSALTGARVPAGVAALVSTYAAWGRMDEAAALHRELVERAREEYVQPTALAYAATALGHLDDAVGFARQALEEQDPLIIFLARLFPDLAPLRERPECQEILVELGLTG